MGRWGVWGYSLEGQGSQFEAIYLEERPRIKRITKGKTLKFKVFGMLQCAYLRVDILVAYLESILFVAKYLGVLGACPFS